LIYNILLFKDLTGELEREEPEIGKKRKGMGEE
jgi:hypothetical protein